MLNSHSFSDRMNRGFFFGLMGLCLMGCQPETPESFGLDNVIALHIAPDDISTMRHGTYSKSKVPVDIELNGEVRSGVIAVAGATSVDDYKKSYEIELDEPYLGMTVFRLNAMSRDPSAMHALTAYHVFELNGVATPLLEPIAVWMNDTYAGLYLFQEKYDNGYFAGQAQNPASLYQAENSVAAMDTSANYDVAFSVKIGNHEMVDLKQMLYAVNEYETTGDVALLEKYVDVPTLLNYMAITSYIDHVDGLVNNYYLLRLNGESRFRFLPWDLDYTFGQFRAPEDVSLLERNQLMRTVLKNDSAIFGEYQSEFKSVARRANAPALAEYVDELVSLIAGAYGADPALSGGPLSLADHAAKLKSHFQEMEDAAGIMQQVDDVVVE